MPDQKKILLEAKDICKSFSGVMVLKNAHFEVRAGEVHALMGENGAGKSTLIKILTGVYTKDSGTIYWDGRAVEINSYKDCQKLGIACIYQELSVVTPLTVAQNVYMGREPRRGPFIDYKKMEQMTTELIEKYDFPLKADTLCENLGMGQRQLVEILKGLSVESRLLIMDEPTASLSGKEAEILFKIIDTLRSKGVSIVYISHRLEEVYRISNRLTVLRDGATVAVLEQDEIDPPRVVEHMLGKKSEIGSACSSLHCCNGETVLNVRDLTGQNNRFRHINLEVRCGEILGIGGLIGAGRSELVRAIYGIDPVQSGEIIFAGQAFTPSPRKSIEAGIGFVPEDRRSQGFVGLLSTEKNVALTNYDLLKKRGKLLKDASEREMALKAIKSLDIRPSDPEKPVGLMSGGNQQKVVLAKWLMRDLRILIVDEPTAGIDIGAKNEIYAIFDELAAKGVAVIVVSSDLEELIRVSHRICVMRNGELVAEFNEGNVTQNDVLMAAQGVQEVAQA